MKKQTGMTIALLFFIILLPITAATAGADQICVRFGISDPVCVVYTAGQGETGISYSAKEGQYVSSAGGWVVQDDYSEEGLLADEAALLEYLNRHSRELGGTTVTLLRVEEDGYLYDDGISYLSVLGDSISTLSGVTDTALYNSNTQGNAARYRNPEAASNETGATLLLERSQTWWNQVAEKAGYTLLVNSSVRGTMASNGIKRCRQLGADTNVEGEMHRNTAPDTIVVYLGTNDYRKKDLTADQFYEYYRKLLKKLCRIYTRAQIYCIDITDCYAPGLSEELLIDQEPGMTAEQWDGTSYRLQHFNRQIALAVQDQNQQEGEERVHLVELSNQNQSMMLTLDLEEDEDMTQALAVNCGAGKTWLSLHPSAAGHRIIADAVLAVMGGGQVPEETLFPEQKCYPLEASGAGEETEGSIWKIDTEGAYYSSDGARLYLDQRTAQEDTVIGKIQIPVVCVSRDLLEDTSDEVHLWLSVMTADGSGQIRETRELIIPGDLLKEAFLKGFHRKGRAVSQLAGVSAVLRWERGGRITEGIYTDCCYVGAYLEIPVDISLSANETLLFGKDQTTKILIDSHLEEIDND